MSRTLPTAFLAALMAKNVRPALFFEGEFTDGWLRLWSGVGEIVWGERTWTGAGILLGIGGIDEGRDVVASGTSVTLSGVPTDLMAVAISKARQGAPGRIYLGLLTFTDLGVALASTPLILFAGILNVPSAASGRETTTITLTYENRLVDLTRARELRYTDETQRQLFPGDRAFEYVTAIQQKAAWVK